MIRNDSDLSINRVDPNAAAMKYNSLDRNGAIGDELSPPERKRKTNVHL